MRTDRHFSLTAITSVVFVALFLSGMSALIYQIVWLRMLKLMFGDTVLAVSTVLAAFMAGLAVGSYFIGRLVDLRSRYCLRYYAFMEIGIGLYALLVPLLLELLVPLGIWVTEQYRTSFYTLGLLRFVISFVLLLPPTALMGGTLPILLKQFAGQTSIVGRNAGRFYAVNTLGAAVGSLSASFPLIGSLGVQMSVVLAAAINILVGLVVLVTSILAGNPAPLAAERGIPSIDAQSPLASERLLRTIPWIYALSGFIALALEIIWVRMLAMLTSMHVQSFGVMLAILLGGIAIGSAIYTRWLAGKINAVAWLIGLQIVIGVWTLLSVPLFRKLPPVPLPPHAPAPDIDAPAPFIAMSVVGPGLVLTLIPALAMGLMLPLIVDFYAANVHKIGRNFGRIYGVNTLGGIGGSFAGGFVLLPLLGVQKSMVLLGVLSIAIACVLVIASQGFRLRPAFGPVAASAALVVAIAAAVGAASDDRPPVRGLNDPWRLIYYREGLTAAIRVFENAETGVRELFSDSWYIASTEHVAMRLQKMLSNLPLLLHPKPEQVLIVGFGTGTTSGVSMQHDVDVDAVELEASERETASLFRHVNYDIMDGRWRQKFTMHIDDGRNWLLTRPKAYDVISRDAHVAKPSQDLFSREFLELAKRRLKPGGIFCGFLPPESTDAVKRMLAAFHSVFPHGSVWYVSPIALLVVGSHEPLSIDYELLKARMSVPRVDQDLRSVIFGDANDLLSSFLMAGDDVKRFVSGTDPASDDKPLGFLSTPDFGSPRDIESLSNELIGHRKSIEPHLRNIADKSELAQLRAQSAAMSNLIRGQLKFVVFRDLEGARKEFEDALAVRGDWNEAQFQYSLALAAEAEGLMAGPDATRAIDLLKKAIEYAGDFAPHHVQLALAYERLGQSAAATAEFSKASDLLEAKGYPPIPLVQQKLAKKPK